jgi:hypothetical protein
MSLNIKYISLYNFCLKTFLILRRTERDIMHNYLCCSLNVRDVSYSHSLSADDANILGKLRPVDRQVAIGVRLLNDEAEGTKISQNFSNYLPISTV